MDGASLVQIVYAVVSLCEVTGHFRLQCDFVVLEQGEGEVFGGVLF